VLDLVVRPDLDTHWLQEAGHAGLLVGVVGAVGDRDKAAFARMRHTAATAMAVALDVDAWAAAEHRRGGATERSGPAPGALWLQAHGWQAVSAAPSSPVAGLWQDLGMAAGSGARRGSPVDPGGQAS
jgi:hypothetical protein